MHSYRCHCKGSKNHHLVYEGGSSIGNYDVNVCDNCYLKIPKKFLIEENMQ